MELEREIAIGFLSPVEFAGQEIALPRESYKKGAKLEACDNLRVTPAGSQPSQGFCRRWTRQQANMASKVKKIMTQPVCICLLLTTLIELELYRNQRLISTCLDLPDPS